MNEGDLPDLSDGVRVEEPNDDDDIPDLPQCLSEAPENRADVWRFDLGRSVVRDIRRGERDLRVDPLTTEELREAVLHCESITMQKTKAARLLRIDRKRYYQVLREIGEETRDSGAFDVDVVLHRLEEVSDFAMAAGARLLRQALSQKNVPAGSIALGNTVKTIERHISTLQSLGVLPKAADRMEIDVQVEQRAKVIFGVVVEAVMAEEPNPEIRQRIKERVERELGSSMV